MPEIVLAIQKEIEIRQEFLQGEKIDTIYFGGGTPSILSAQALDSIIKQVHKTFKIEKDLEFTLEANPDDLNKGKLEDFKRLGINRLSMGIQSFIDSELNLMNRVHDEGMARKAIEMALSAGFSDMTIDLIFGMPGSDETSWQHNLKEALKYEIPHYSIYNLTVEPGTALDHFIKKGQVEMPSDELMAHQFRMTQEIMQKAGFEHYEISNYALKGRYARHNTSYWQGVPYLGLGPSAHSFNKGKRYWNVSNNSRYIKSLEKGELAQDFEVLSMDDQYNEYILTGFRTQWGCQENKVKEFGKKYFSHFLENVKPFIEKAWIKKKDSQYVLTQEGKLFADQISSDLFI